MTHWKLDLLCTRRKKTLVALPITFCQTWVLRAAAKTTASWSWLAMENCHLLCTQTKPTYWRERNVLNHRSEHKQLRTGQCSPLKLRVSTHLGTKGLSHAEIAGKLCGSQEPFTGCHHTRAQTRLHLGDFEVFSLVFMHEASVNQPWSAKPPTMLVSKDLAWFANRASAAEIATIT